MSNVIGMQVQGQLAEITQLRFVDVKNSNIVEYTAQFTKFYDDKGTRTDRRDAEFLWSYEVRNSYLKDDPNFERLLSQVSNPMSPYERLYNLFDGQRFIARPMKNSGRNAWIQLPASSESSLRLTSDSGSFHASLPRPNPKPTLVSS